MIWLVEKKLFHHFFDLGFECVEIPVRVKFEFGVKDGVLVPDSISKMILYNRSALERRYPNVDRAKLQQSIEENVESEIHHYLKARGYLRGNGS